MLIGSSLESEEVKLIRAQRTCYVVKLIIHRENKFATAHRVLEQLIWNDLTPYLAVHKVVEAIFKCFHKSSALFKIDLKRALESAKYLSPTFIAEYNKRSTKSFLEALLDYEKSVIMLFGPEHLAKIKGWTPVSILARNFKPLHVEDLLTELKNLKKFSKRLRDLLTQNKS